MVVFWLIALIYSGSNSILGATIASWKDVKSIVFNSKICAAIKKDGRVFSSKFSDVTNQWKDIIELTISSDVIVGLRKDGTEFNTNNSSFVSKADDNLMQLGSVYLGLKNNGKTTRLNYGINFDEEILKLENIVYIQTIEGDDSNIFALKSDGTLFTSSQKYSSANGLNLSNIAVKIPAEKSN